MIVQHRPVYVASSRYRQPRACLTRATALRVEARAAVWHVLVARSPEQMCELDNYLDGDRFSDEHVERMRDRYVRALRLRVWLDKRARAAR